MRSFGLSMCRRSFKKSLCGIREQQSASGMGVVRHAWLAVIVGSAVAWPDAATAQIYYTAMAPVPYVSNYVPSGNYAAVTAFSPPVVSPSTVVANYPVLPTPSVVATVPTSSVAVTSYYSPSLVPVSTPVTAFYAPAAVPVSTYYAPTVAAPAVVSPAVVAPVAAYYPPVTTVRRGLFGAYRYRTYPGGWYVPY